MKLELKGIKVLLANSEETYCYTGTLYVDGKRVGVVSNDGHGGCDRFDGDWREYQRINEWVAANLPPLDMSAYGMSDPIPESLEGWCASQVSTFLSMRDMKGTLRRKVLTVEDGKLYATTFKGVKLVTPDLVDRYVKAHPGKTVLNAMPEAEALRLYLEAGAA